MCSGQGPSPQHNQFVLGLSAGRLLSWGEFLEQQRLHGSVPVRCVIGRHGLSSGLASRITREAGGMEAVLFMTSYLVTRWR